MFFKDIPGHEEIKHNLISAYRNERVAHAQMFIGKKGSANLAMAVAFARYVLCTNTTDTDACGECKACKQTNAFTHPDLHFMFPVVRKPNSSSPSISDNYINEWRAFLKVNPYASLFDWLQFIEAENKQGNISVEDCHNMIKKFSLKSFESETKIMIIWHPEVLGKSGNSLLKIIEEPPGNALIILVAPDENQVLQTIVSRTQFVVIPQFTNDEIINYLKTQKALDEDTVHEIAFIADADMGAALRLAESEDSERSEQFRLLIRCAWERNIENINGWSTEIERLGRERQKNFIEYSVKFLREAFILKVNPQYVPKLNKEDVKRVKYIADKLDMQSLSEFTDLLEKSHNYISRNANGKILFFNLGIKVMNIVNRKQELTPA